MEAWNGGNSLYAADTDGQVFESRDNGNTRSIYRALMKDRPRLVTVDDMAFSKAAAERHTQVTA